jgi:hypothetical protein
VDVLYVGISGREPADWDESAEGDGLRYGPDGSLVGITIVNARRRLDRDGKLVITLPEQQVEAADLGDALAVA